MKEWTVWLSGPHYSFHDKILLLSLFGLVFGFPFEFGLDLRRVGKGREWTQGDRGIRDARGQGYTVMWSPQNINKKLKKKNLSQTSHRLSAKPPLQVCGFKTSSSLTERQSKCCFFHFCLTIIPILDSCVNRFFPYENIAFFKNKFLTGEKVSKFEKCKTMVSQIQNLAWCALVCMCQQSHSVSHRKRQTRHFNHFFFHLEKTKGSWRSWFIIWGLELYSFSTKYYFSIKFLM